MAVIVGAEVLAIVGASVIGLNEWADLHATAASSSIRSAAAPTLEQSAIR